MPRTRLYPHGNGVFRPYPPEHRRPRIFGRAPAVIGDIQPYPSMIESNPDGTPVMVTSRSQHREILRRHGCEEIGTEKPGWMREKEYLVHSGMPEEQASAEIDAKLKARRLEGIDMTGIEFKYEEPDPVVLGEE